MRANNNILLDIFSQIKKFDSRAASKQHPVTFQNVTVSQFGSAYDL